MKRNLLIFVGSLLVMSHLGVAHGDEMSSIRDSLRAVDVKCEVTENGKNVVGSFTVADDKSYGVFVEKETFSLNGETFRMVWGGLTKRPKANELTDEQLEWILIENGKNKFGGTVFLYGDDHSTILVRIPVPANADGTTLKSAMWMCANLLEEVDGKIPEKSDSETTAPQKSETSSRTTPPKASSSTASTDDISDILAKAENHDGIVIDGLYLGMKINDAKRVIAHLLGTGFGVSDWKCSSWNEYYWKYYIGGVPGYSMRRDTENTLCFMVLKKNDRVNSFSFNTAAVKKLVGKKQPVSKERLGTLFFSKFDLDGTRDYEDNLKMVTPDHEYIMYDSSDSSVFWSFELGEGPSDLRP